MYEPCLPAKVELDTEENNKAFAFNYAVSSESTSRFLPTTSNMAYDKHSNIHIIIMVGRA